MKNGIILVAIGLMGLMWSIVLLDNHLVMSISCLLIELTGTGLIIKHRLVNRQLHQLIMPVISIVVILGMLVTYLFITR